VVSAAAAGALALGVAGCGESGGGGGGQQGGQELSGTIAIDGSSTVFPFAQAAAERFMAENPNVQVTVGQSGTGGGFEKFCAGETQIADASRPIEADEEEACKKEDVSYKEAQVANDGIAVATNKTLRIDCLTTDHLKELWNKGSDVKSYSDVEARLPNQRVSLYGPGTDSGTFDYFTEEINGEEGASRTDYQPSEDDNVLVQGVSGDPGGLGYFGYSYFEQNQDKLNLVGIDSGDGCVKPSAEAIQNGDYKPLGRPLYMYPSDEAMRRPEVKAFMDFVVRDAPGIAKAAKIVPLSPEQLEETRREAAS
jgi:phosphate transport system substrate-binding protein